MMIVTSVLTVWQQMGFPLQSRLKFATPSSFLFTVSLLILLMIMMIFFTLPYNFEMPLLVVIMMLWLLLFMVVIPIREAKRAEFSRSRPSCLPSRLLCHTSLPGKGHHRRHRWYHRHNHHHWGQAGLWPPRPWWVNFAPCFAPLVLSLVGSVTFPDMQTQTHTHANTNTHNLCTLALYDQLGLCILRRLLQM